MDRALRTFCSDESGATAVEYALMALIVGLGIIVGLQGLPVAFNARANSVATNF